MPLLDHFHPPLSMERPWEGIYSTWASTIATQLNQDQLPAEYFAMPLVTLGGGMQVDVGTFQTGAQPESPNGGVVTQIWAPPQPPLSAVVDFISLDVYEVRVMQQMGGPKLRSAIELVSPANKDWASHRRAFAVKCAGYLQQGVAVIIVDVVTEADSEPPCRLSGHPGARTPPRLVLSLPTVCGGLPSNASCRRATPGSMAGGTHRRGRTAHHALVVERGAVPAAGARGKLSGDLCRSPDPRVTGTG
jgi:hypothetical protein